MTDRAAAIEMSVRHAERQSESIVADKRLPQILALQTDDAWRRWIQNAINPEKHRAMFADVRALIRDQYAIEAEADAAYDEAEAILRRFNQDRMMLADLCAGWDATAPRRHARMPRSKSKPWRAIAYHLLTTVGGTKNQQWQAIPEGDGFYLANDGEQIEVYRDGNDLCCSSRRLGDEKIAGSTFFRRYLKAGKDTSG